MYILYIPFSFDDALFDLQFKASKWREDYENKGKEVIVVYHGMQNDAIKLKMQQSLHAGGYQIYILSHGIDTPILKVANQAKLDDTYMELTMDEVAEHFKEDLVTPEFNNNNVVKLYFCDEYRQDDKSRQMAVRFRQQLGDTHATLNIQYYTDVSIGIPGTVSEGLFGVGGKGAVRSFQLSNDIFYFSLSAVVGRARSFRHGLDEVAEKVRSPRFFICSAEKEIEYPEFSHPILKQLAEKLVKLVQSDRLLARNQDVIIAELLKSLPLDLNDYMVNSLTMISKNVKLEIKINKPQLEKYLIQLGVISSDNKKVKVAENKKQSWVDDDDFLSTATISGEQDLFLDFAADEHALEEQNSLRF